MIPTHIIEKAIAGGWKIHTTLTSGWLKRGLAVPVGVQRMAALDTDFWVALGKEMGWDKKEPREAWPDYWMQFPMKFYRLILRKAPQEEITRFWETL